MSIADFIKTINAQRLQTKWYSFVGVVGKKTIQIKGYGTWLQRFKVDGIEYGNCGDRTVRQFKDDLLAPFDN